MRRPATWRQDLTLFLADQPIQAQTADVDLADDEAGQRHWKGLAALGLTTVLLLLCAVAARFVVEFRLRSVNEQLAHEIDRADRHAHEARVHAEISERHAQAAASPGGRGTRRRPARTGQLILRDVPLNAGREMPRSFVWRYLWHRARREIVVLYRPTPRFTGMALSPDGKLLATTDGTAGLELWDAASGDRIRDMEKVARQLASPTFSADGSPIIAEDRGGASASADGFSVWDVASGRRLARLSMDSGFFALSSTFLPENVLLGSGHHDKRGSPPRTRLWSLAGDPCASEISRPVRSLRRQGFRLGRSRVHHE